MLLLFPLVFSVCLRRTNEVHVRARRVLPFHRESPQRRGRQLLLSRERELRGQLLFGLHVLRVQGGEPSHQQQRRWWRRRRADASAAAGESRLPRRRDGARAAAAAAARRQQQPVPADRVLQRRRRPRRVCLGHRHERRLTPAPQVTQAN